MFEAGQIPDVRESSPALCVKRGAFAHHLLIRGRSRSQGSKLSDEAQCFKEKLRSPDSIGSNPTPPSTEWSQITSQGEVR